MFEYTLSWAVETLAISIANKPPVEDVTAPEMCGRVIRVHGSRPLVSGTSAAQGLEGRLLRYGQVFHGAAGML